MSPAPVIPTVVNAFLRPLLVITSLNAFTAASLPPLLKASIYAFCANILVALTAALPPTMLTPLPTPKPR